MRLKLRYAFLFVFLRSPGSSQGPEVSLRSWRDRKPGGACCPWGGSCCRHVPSGQSVCVFVSCMGLCPTLSPEALLEPDPPLFLPCPQAPECED